MGIGRFAAGLIRAKAQELVGKGGFTESDVEDIEQELRLQLLKRLPQFDPEKGEKKAFIRWLIDVRATSLLRRRMAEKRDSRRESFSLNEIAVDPEGHPAERSSFLEGNVGPNDEQRDLSIDLAKALEQLPPGLHTLWHERMVSTPTEIAEKYGVHRKTVWTWIRQLRAELRRRGIGKYLENNVTPPTRFA